MKVLFITRCYPPRVGGMEKLSYRLTTLFPSDQKYIIAYKFQSLLGLIWFVPYSMFKSLFLISKVDIVHISDPVMAVVAAFLKIFGQKKIICNVHGLDITYQNPIYQIYLKIFLRFIDSFICISHFTQTCCQVKGLKQTVVIPIGISIQKNEMKVNRKIKDKKNTILTVGRLEKRKGVAWFLQNVYPYLDKKPFYYIVGKGSQKNKLNTIIHKLKLNKNVFLCGQVTDKQLEKIYQKANLFVMPNIQIKNDIEGFGIVALEASLRKLPVLAANCHGINQAIVHNKNGWLIKSGESKKWISFLNHKLKNKHYLQKKALEFSKYTQLHFSEQKMIKNYYHHFQKILYNN